MAVGMLPAGSILRMRLVPDLATYRLPEGSAVTRNGASMGSVFATPSPDRPTLPFRSPEIVVMIPAELTERIEPLPVSAMRMLPLGPMAPPCGFVRPARRAVPVTQPVQTPAVVVPAL